MCTPRMPCWIFRGFSLDWLRFAIGERESILFEHLIVRIVDEPFLVAQRSMSVEVNYSIDESRRG
jgi:hypothetical protein